jgi:hypothetical protein
MKDNRRKLVDNYLKKNPYCSPTKAAKELGVSLQYVCYRKKKYKREDKYFDWAVYDNSVL